MAYQGGNDGQPYKEGVVWHLMAMGYKRDECVAAAKATHGQDVEAAFNWLEQHKSGNNQNNNNYNNNNNNNQYGGYNNNNNNNGNMYNNNNNNNHKAQYNRKNSYNEAHFYQLKDLGLGDNDEERKEACRRYPDNMDGAMEYLFDAQRRKENQKKNNNNNSNNNNNNRGGFWNRWGNNNNHQNSERYKINQIKNKYPKLSEPQIKDLLSRHNGDLQNTLKFIDLKAKEEQERERQLARQQEEAKNEVTEEELANLFMSLLSLAVVEEAGFLIAADENRMEIMKRLKQVNPSGQTALRDAVVVGIIHMLKVKQLLVKLGALKHKFVHIVLTDGEDTASKGSQNELKGFFLRLGHELGDICKTFFIGVGLNWKEKHQLEQISALGGDSCELFNCQDVEIDDVFSRISVSLGIRRQIAVMEHQGMILAAKKDQLALEIKENKYLVLFTLDMSGSMSGGRWRKVCAAVEGFMTGLKSHDIVGCILFNEKPTIITDK